LRQTKESQHEAGQLTADLSQTSTVWLRGPDKTEFYAHDQNWSNRMILGDSLQVMASLAEREGLRGKVQCIYFDPPYGIKFNRQLPVGPPPAATLEMVARPHHREPDR